MLNQHCLKMTRRLWYPSLSPECGSGTAHSDHFKKGSNMANVTRAYTSDGSWRLLLETWRVRAVVYNAIGATVHAQHWEEFTVWLFVKKKDWVNRPVPSIAVSATFEGVTPTLVPGASQRVDSRADSDNAAVRLWAAGTSIEIPPGSTPPQGPGLPPPGTPRADPNTPALLEVRNVRATARAIVNGETLVCNEASLL